MSWILDHLNLVIVAVLVIGSFLKSRFDAMNQDVEEPEDQPDFGPFGENQRQAPPLAPYVPPRVERTPPPVPIEETISQPTVFAATHSQSGALRASSDEAASILAKQRDIQERLRAIRAARPAPRSSRSSTRTKVTSKKSTPVAGSAPISIRARLHNPAELRRAVILREILDRPVGLR